MRILLYMLLALLSAPTFAAYRSQGWNWYSSPPVDYSDEADQDDTTNNNAPQSYADKIEALQAHHKESLSRAIMTQSVEDVAYAMRLNQWMMEQANGYGRAFKQALLKYPELSHELKFPTAQVARQVAWQEKKDKRNKAIARFSEDYGLFYFYRGKNRYDQAMAQSVQDLADEYQIKLIGFAIDNQPLPEIKNNQVHRGQMKTLGVQASPALFLVNPKTKQAMPLAYGFIAQDDVKDHFVDLATNYGEEPLI